jgi:hypothetical protein
MFSVDGVALKSTLDLASWIGSSPMSDSAMVMGDL